MKYNHVNALFLMLFFYTSCTEQNLTDLPTITIKSESQDVITSNGGADSTRTIPQDGYGNNWFAFLQDKILYNGNSFNRKAIKVNPSRFVSVFEDRKGSSWFATNGSGVYYYNGKDFKKFTTKEGLANDNVTCIYEDKAGNIWFGTEGGASCYDGKTFRNYTTTEGLTDNNVSSIIEDKKGKFWFGTKGDACVYDGKTFTVFTQNGKSFKDVSSIFEDKEGHLWLGNNDGLWCYNGSTITNFAPKKGC
ncbi:MAG: histidine kinase [Sphingobacteriales bacterium]|nr:histidine kinase [Sphingobacteriales bacterium]